MPFSLTREPVSAPAGIFTLIDSVCRVRPIPWQDAHCFVVFLPVPPHELQGWDILKNPFDAVILPVPLQVLHC
jgi:hypothetical protein